MAKFVIECPKCGRYASAKTGVFARRKIECECGYTIHTKFDRMSTRVCPTCGNTFAYDQKDGTKVRCPVCHKKVIATDEQTKYVEIKCKQCGVQIHTVKGNEKQICPICDFENDVQERLIAEDIKNDGLAHVIKFEGNNDILIWKHPVEDFNFGSQLIVHESQEAIFFRDGQALDLFGAGRYALETAQLPILEELYDLPTDSESTFHSEVYFINMSTQMGIKWGTDTKVRLFDPVTKMHVELGASGEFNIKVVNSRKLLLKLVGTTSDFTQEQIMGGDKNGVFRSMVITQVKSYLAAVIKEKAISVLELDEHLVTISDSLKGKINEILWDYGLEISEFYVARIVTPDDDPNFKRMKEQFAEQYLGVKQEEIRKNIAEMEATRRKVEAQTDAQMRIINAQGEAEVMKIKALAEAEAYRAQALAEAEEMRAKGYTYQQETARQVSLEAMQNGLTGGAGEGHSGIIGGISEIANLGLTLGTMGSVVSMTKDVLEPVMSTTAQMGQAVGNIANREQMEWDCKKCGQTRIRSNFCPNCGNKRVEENSSWICSQCGKTGITTNFCPDCGMKKPSTIWNCSNCGQQNISTNFCPNCGNRRG